MPKSQKIGKASQQLTCTRDGKPKSEKCGQEGGGPGRGTAAGLQKKRPFEGGGMCKPKLDSPNRKGGGDKRHFKTQAKSLRGKKRKEASRPAGADWTKNVSPVQLEKGKMRM